MPNNKVGFIADKIVKQKSTLCNHGRARKVSFKRPSPQMSRDRLAQIKAAAILEATLEMAQ